ncbi:MAG: hypothetical protein AAF938_23145 [Myxococcota bacterium]
MNVCSFIAVALMLGLIGCGDDSSAVPDLAFDVAVDTGADGAVDAAVDATRDAMDAMDAAPDSSCTPECSAGESRCVDGNVQRCNATSCPVFFQFELCDPGTSFCEASDGNAACVEGCEGDFDCDGVLPDDDCDDTNPMLGARAQDMDCDGALTADDCNDMDGTVGAQSEDMDCDGALTADDCDDMDAASTTRAEDMDCDGVLAAEDCDDMDPDSITRADDGDCDGVSPRIDCDDSDPAIGATFADADCDGVPDVVYTQKNNGDDVQDCISDALCLARGGSGGLFNSVDEDTYVEESSPTGTVWRVGFAGQGEDVDYGIWGDTIRAASWTPRVPIALRTDDGRVFNTQVANWTGGGGRGGGFGFARAEAVFFLKEANADFTDPANQDCVVPGVCLTRQDIRSLYNASEQTEFDGVGPSGTEWAFGPTASLSAEDYASFSEAVGSPMEAVGRVLSLHITGTNIYFDLVLTRFDGGRSGGGFSWVRSRAIVFGCSDSDAANFDARATADEGFCGDWVQFSAPSDLDVELPQNQDCVTPDVCITRGTQGRLFNVAANPDHLATDRRPEGTLWRAGPPAETWNPADFETWTEVWGSNAVRATNASQTMWLPTERRLFEVVVRSLPGDGTGGGVTYYRRELPTPGVCGDDTLDPGEGCDDGNTDDGDGCQSNCLVVYCGNAIVESGEVCDEGPRNGTRAGRTCRPDCTLPLPDAESPAT